MWMGYWLIFAKKKVVRSECALIIMYYAEESVSRGGYEVCALPGCGAKGCQSVGWCGEGRGFAFARQPQGGV